MRGEWTRNGVGFVAPEQPLAVGVKAFTTTRSGGVSRPPYASLNLAEHTGDDRSAVAENRRLLEVAAELPEPPRWLAQVHGTEVVAAHEQQQGAQADASWTDRPGVVCAVLTADCLPVVFAAQDGSSVAVAHAGWRGLCAGVLEETLDAMPVPAGQIVAWLGPAIGADAFEVGRDVKEAFMNADPASQEFFVPGREGRFYADLYSLALLRLKRRNIKDVFGYNWCTFKQRQLFFSYRRDGARTGRMATLVCRES
ncbi:peptidoglycan editing factor PgeF [Halorhodospira halochloris]|uniref:Purine nucleoside phosphorylase n=1 Tax=Halorhodospira halochloris TaxID=1052 RepID=A0A0X8X8H6_HALHR|nr:peptidoglycan editing factor PgeF [Halorhodospira halochloris]MBK1652305.1 multi-copper polyphenol oxidoreductase [Halorhodospira halochloris]MCG5529724.1 peptidoglycan editing factor PgeF [Halorhodospira halochloris]MCG5548378.1 peptidoglycan editing factor PgeF [Halorhodospira halochloris]BAU56898.1 Uncharacterized conserved protein [Halorhodospira halochloris]